MATKYVIGFDGGATKTKAIIARDDGEVLSYAESGPSNYHVVGIEGAKQSILKAFLEARDRGKLKIDRLDVAVAGLAGLDCTNDEKILNQSIPTLDMADKFVIVHDSINALYGASGGGLGVIVIAGTGSVAAGMDSNGQTVRVGGWGPILGDEGSAYEIGRKGLTAALMSFDGRLKGTAIEEEIRKALGIDSTDDIIAKVYGERMSVTQIASLAPIVTKLASQGDEVALTIVREAAEGLSSLVKAVITKLKLRELEFPLATVGGVFKAGRIILDPFVQSISELAPKAKVGKPRMSPALGSVLIALKIARGTLTPEVIDRVEKTGLEIVRD